MKPATFRLVAHYLNQLRQRVLPGLTVVYYKYVWNSYLSILGAIVFTKKSCYKNSMRT
jgi:hypothetical protein